MIEVLRIVRGLWRRLWLYLFIYFLYFVSLDSYFCFSLLVIMISLFFFLFLVRYFLMYTFYVFRGALHF
jgi:hypothetical protein